MYIIRLAVISVMTILLLSCSREKKENIPAAIFIKDDLNNTISLTSIPHRVISLAPNMTEMIFALGAGSKIVGNTLYCNYPEAAQKITKVGDMISIDYEKILNLKPDLIFITVEGNAKDGYEKLNRLGFKVFVSNPRNYAGIKKTFRDLGIIFGSKNLVNTIIKNWDERFEQITEQTKKYPPKTAMFIIGSNPIILAGKNTFINELMKSVGLTNIANDSPLNYPIFSREEIIKRNPDFIIITGMLSGESKKIISIYKEWKSLKAVQNNNVIVVDPDLFLRPGPRFIEALEDLFRKLHHR
jgi:iron complex transport system substrate-binding protein